MPRIELCLLSTTDLHLSLCPEDSKVDDGKHLFGLSTLISAERTRWRNCLLFDNGDFLQGGILGPPLTHLLNRHPRRNHPMISAMNLLKFDAVALGNHEFDLGLPFLRRALRTARFPVLCANLILPARDYLKGVQRCCILERDLHDDAGLVWPVKIGVFGVLPPLVTVWARDQLPQGTVCDPILDTARHAVSALQDEGADVIIALCHSGLRLPGSDSDDENLAEEVAQVPGVDAVIAGHTHEVYPRPDSVDTIHQNSSQVHSHAPLCMAGAEGSHLGRILLTLQRDSAGKWRSLGGQADVIPAPVPSPKKKLERRHKRRCETLMKALDPFLSAIVGQTACALTSHFAHVRDCAATRLVAMAMRDYVQKALSDTLFRDIPVLGVASAQRCGGHGGASNYVDLPPGLLRERDLASLSPFPNQLHALLTTGAGVAVWLEHAAGSFATIVPGRLDQPLLRPDVIPYNFDVIEGLSYTIDLTSPPRFGPRGGLINPERHRIRDLRHNGKPVEPDAPFILAVNSFRSSGGGFFPGTGADGAQILADPPAIDEVLRHWLAQTGVFSKPQSTIWRFAPVPGASVLFTTSRDAVRHLPLPGLALRGETGNGFITLSLELSPLASQDDLAYVSLREVGAGRRLANPVRSGRKQP